ncbi:tripartite tricarboxylate transporter substrate binding protein [Betaproteobacteria bacterium PRO7]|jgi:tripartite-type tricarboxylate transporter receptor subunit TctC|nr:tripartite tricarboxylate transporter substrate binding protein [Betaproteobacteria bacterium PRO7]
MKRLHLSIAAACAAALLAAGPAALAQTGSTGAAAWPAKPVRIVAVFPPGGSVDQVARVLSAQLAQQLGQQFVVENKGGASGSIGTAEVARAAPDGYTFAVVFDTHAVNPSLIPNLPFDTVKDLAPVMLIGTSAMAIVAHASQPYKDFRDVIAAAKAKPGSVSFGSIGTGSLGHLAMAQIGNQLGIEWTHVPYRGGGPLMNDAVAGQVPLAIGTVFLVNPHVKSGKVRALAVTSRKPDPSLPGAAPLVDQGVPGFEALAWWGVFAPAGTPPPIVRRMHEELAKALKVSAVAERLTGQGMEIVGGGPEQLDRFVRAEIDRWGKVVRDNKIKAGD